MKEALSSRGGANSITTVKTDLVWPTLTDDKSDTKDVVLFYEEFEDVCALANNCRGMSAREKLLALRARCKGSRAKTYTNAYRAAWKTGEVVDDPEAVYLRIKNKHLMFGESREEREVRIDGEHQALVKGRLSGHQFEPLFEASVADLESVGLGKTPRELYLSYLRKMPPHLQKEIRLAGGCQGGGRRTARWPTRRTRPRQGSPRTRLRPWLRRRTRSGTSRRLPRWPRPGLLVRAARTAPWRPVPAPRVAEREQLARSASTSATTATARRATLALSPTTRSYAGAAPKAKPKAKPKAAAKGAEASWRCARSSRRRARAGRERTVTWCTACWPGRVKSCRPTGALPRERP